MISNTVKLGYVNIAGAGQGYIGNYDAATMTARTMVNGQFIDARWNGSSWALIQEEKTEVQETTPAPTRQTKKPGFITRKALVKKLQEMNLSEILVAGTKRTANWRGYVVIEALRNLINAETFNQSTHVSRRGNIVKNPKWFAQMFVNLEWASGDITPGSILQALA